jgi:group I intron endonuclease
MIFHVYYIRCNTNGKGYVGATKNLVERLRYHQYGWGNKKRAFNRAVKKYGWDNFDVFILEETEDQNKAFNQLEPYYIKLKIPLETEDTTLLLAAKVLIVFNTLFNQNRKYLSPLK